MITVGPIKEKREPQQASDKRDPVLAREPGLRREVVAVMRLRRVNGPAAFPEADSRRRSGSPGSRSEARESRRLVQLPRVSPLGRAVKIELRILAVSDYEGLRSSRALLLEQEGYRVVSVASRDLLEMGPLPPFEVAILCQSVDACDAVRIAEKLRRLHPGIRMLRIQSTHGARSTAFDMELDGFAGPELLLNAVRKLMAGLELR